MQQLLKAVPVVVVSLVLGGTACPETTPPSNSPFDGGPVFEPEEEPPPQFRADHAAMFPMTADASLKGCALNRAGALCLVVGSRFNVEDPWVSWVRLPIDGPGSEVAFEGSLPVFETLLSGPDDAFWLVDRNGVQDAEGTTVHLMRYPADAIDSDVFPLAEERSVFFEGFHLAPSTVSIDDENRIVFAGRIARAEQEGLEGGLFIARAAADGTLDASFGDQGLATLPAPNEDVDGTWSLEVGPTRLWLTATPADSRSVSVIAFDEEGNHLSGPVKQSLDTLLFDPSQVIGLKTAATSTGTLKATWTVLQQECLGLLFESWIYCGVAVGELDDTGAWVDASPSRPNWYEPDGNSVYGAIGALVTMGDGVLFLSSSLSDVLVGDERVFLQESGARTWSAAADKFTLDWRPVAMRQFDDERLTIVGADLLFNEDDDVLTLYLHHFVLEED